MNEGRNIISGNIVRSGLRMDMKGSSAFVPPYGCIVLNKDAKRTLRGLGHIVFHNKRDCSPTSQRPERKRPVELSQVDTTDLLSRGYMSDVTVYQPGNSAELSDDP